MAKSLFGSSTQQPRSFPSYASSRRADEQARASCCAGEALFLDPGQGFVQRPSKTPVHLGDLLVGRDQRRAERDAVEDRADDEPVLLSALHAIGGNRKL